MMTAWRFASLAVCFVALAGCDVVQVIAQSEQARGMFERTLTVDGPVELSVRTGSGSIDIRTGTGNRVQIIWPSQRGWVARRDRRDRAGPKS